MDDLIRIAGALQAAQTKSDALAIATVFNTRGSAFRRAGARMLIKRSGITEGSISAGCLEKDVVAHCDRWKSGKKEPFILTYDGNNRDDLVFGLHLGCDGLIQILVEPLLADSLYGCINNTEFSGNVAATTIVESSDKRVPLGLALVRNESCARWSKAVPAPVIDQLDLQSELVYTKEQSALTEIDVRGCKLTLFTEFVKAIPSVLLIGSGAEAAPLAKILQTVGWNYTLVDDRKGRIEASVWNQLSLASIEPKQFPQWLQQSHFSAAILMTHDYDRDKTILRSLLSCQLSYLGIVGPRKRTDKLLAEMVLEGICIPDDGLRYLHSPAGLDIGAERPEEIALSIAAEIQAALAKRAGGFLKNKRGPIHEIHGIHEKSSKQIHVEPDARGTVCSQ